MLHGINRGNSPLSGQALLPNKDEPHLPPRPIRSIGKELRIVPGKERFYGKYFLSHPPGWVPSALCVPSTFPSPTRDHHSLCWWSTPEDVPWNTVPAQKKGKGGLH